MCGDCGCCQAAVFSGNVPVCRACDEGVPCKGKAGKVLAGHIDIPEVTVFPVGGSYPLDKTALRAGEALGRQAKRLVAKPGMGKGHTVPEDVKKKVLAIDPGLSHRAVAQRVGVSDVTVAKIRAAAGIPTPPSTYNPKKRKTVPVKTSRPVVTDEDLPAAAVPKAEEIVFVGNYQQRPETTGAYPKPASGWTCFFCGETFTTFGAAQDHFGLNSCDKPACQIKAGEERGLVMALRRAQIAEAEWMLRALKAEGDQEAAEQRAVDLETGMRQYKPFAECRSMRDIFNLFDFTEGKLLAAEETIHQQARQALEQITEVRARYESMKAAADQFHELIEAIHQRTAT